MSYSGKKLYNMKDFTKKVLYKKVFIKKLIKIFMLFIA